MPRSRPALTPARGTCQPPMPSCTRFEGGHVGDVGGVKPWTSVHDLVHIAFLRIHVAVEMDDAHLALYALGDSRGRMG